MPKAPSLVQRGMLLLFGLTALLAVVSAVFFGAFGGPARRESTLDAAQVAKEESPPGWLIRYNATLTLARRGSTQTPLDVLAEMLDEKQQLRNFSKKLPDGKVVPDEGDARQTLINALKAVANLYEHPEAVKAVGPESPNLKLVQEAVEKLTSSQDVSVRRQAEATRAAMSK